MELSDGLSEVQMVNLYMLLMLRESVLKNIVSACGRFGVAEDLARFVTSLSHPQIASIIVNVGNECMFLPRQNLTQLLSLPLPLLAPAFAVHPPQPAPPPSGHDTRDPEPNAASASTNQSRSA